MEAINTILSQLTYDDLDQWAGEKILGRGKSYIKRVEGIHRTEEDDLVAWVSDTEEYATLVRLDHEGQHGWFCTCPYEDGPCKHAVAVILAAAQQVKQQREIPLLDQDDDLHLILFGDQDDDMDWGDDEHEMESEPEVGPGKTKKAGTSKVRKLLEGKSREELLDLMVAFAKESPEIERSLLEDEQLRSGQIEPLVRSLRKEIKSLTEEHAWYSHWNNEGNIPDYSHVRRQFRALLDRGRADELLALGDELWRLGTEQIEQADDEGQTQGALSKCLEIVLQAVPQSSLTRAGQLLWVIDRLLADEFSLLESGDEMLSAPAYEPSDWREVAAALDLRLGLMEKPRGANFSDTYKRTELINRLVEAYQLGGEPEKILPLLEKEADVCQNYEHLVARLLAAGNKEQARQWCIRGFGCTLKESPGIASKLQKQLREMAAADKRDDLVTAYRAQDFFCHASLETYRELRKAAEKIGTWPKLRESVLNYLETGQRPDLPNKKGAAAVWPLPAPEVVFPQEKEAGLKRYPDRQTLIDIAISEKRFDDVVSLYQTVKKNARTGWHGSEKVAKAVVKTHPEVALEIWRGIVDRLIAEVKPKAYIEAGGFLRLMRKVFEAGNRQADWQALLTELRRTHKAKRRLLEVLDSLSSTSKKIVG
jgi:uncharacterized Zn finger protein